MIFRALLPALARAAAGGDEGDDVPRRVRRRRLGDRRATTASSRPSAAATAAALTSDGPDAVQTHGQNTENAPVEETELNYPVRVTRLSLVEDSDGAGPLPRRPRPAQGLPLRPPDDVHGARRPRQGGARAGALRRPRRQAAPSTCSCAAARSGGSSAKTTLEARGRATSISYRTCGGGGYGPPSERDPSWCVRDVREGKVSAARARELYRVEIDPTELDAVATARLRAGRDRPDHASR